MINNLKSLLNSEKKLFKSYSMKFYFIDGSIVETDKMTFKNFKKMVDQEIKGTEFREPVEDDYKDEFDNILYLLNNINESNYFKVIIKGEHKTFTPENIIRIEPLVIY